MSNVGQPHPVTKTGAVKDVKLRDIGFRVQCFSCNMWVCSK